MISELKESFYPAHGGEIERVARENNFAVEDLIDFSANINPAPPPERVLRRLAEDAQNVALLARYPDLRFHELRAVLSAHHKISAENFVFANGSAALIDAALRSVAPKNCLLPVPAFSEYARALAACNSLKINFALEAEKDFVLPTAQFIEALKRIKPQFCIINNPHNPTGAIIARAELEKIVEAAACVKTTVLLDEAFIDYAPDESLIPVISAFENLVVMRSVTKFFSIPALRVGYAVAAPSLAAKMSQQIPSWSVTTLAANAAAEIYRDELFVQKTRQQNSIEKDWLKSNLENLGIKVYPSAANFLLLELRTLKTTFAEFLRELIITHKIIVRDCTTYENLKGKSYIRIAVLSRVKNEQLVSALAKYNEANSTKK